MNKTEIGQFLHRCRAWLFRTLANGLFDAYRPELHYMRGRGPKWRAKHCARSDGNGTQNPIPTPSHTVGCCVSDPTHMKKPRQGDGAKLVQTV